MLGTHIYACLMAIFTDNFFSSFSAADLTPIPLIRTPDLPSFPNLPSLRGRMEQQVDAIAGSANKVLLGVVDTSFGVLRSFLPGSTPQSNSVTLMEEPATGAPWNSVKPGFGLLRRESGFSIAGLAASLPGNRARSVYEDGEEAGQQLITVSRPGSIKSAAVASDDDATDSEGGSDENSGDENEQEGDEQDDGAGGHDTRSIKSFESMMSGSARERKEASERKSLSDRLANMSGLSRLAHGQSHKVRRSLTFLLPVAYLKLAYSGLSTGIKAIISVAPCSWKSIRFAFVIASTIANVCPARSTQSPVRGMP